MYKPENFITKIHDGKLIDIEAGPDVINDGVYFTDLEPYHIADKRADICAFVMGTKRSLRHFWSDQDPDEPSDDFYVGVAKDGKCLFAFEDLETLIELLHLASNNAVRLYRCRVEILM